MPFSSICINWRVTDTNWKECFTCILQICIAMRQTLNLGLKSPLLPFQYMLLLLVPHYFSKIGISGCSIFSCYTSLPQMDVDISSYNRPFIKQKYLKNLNAINIYMALSCRAFPLCKIFTDPVRNIYSILYLIFKSSLWIFQQYSIYSEV